MRVSYCFSLRDPNRLVYEADEDFIKRLSPSIAPEIGAILKAQNVPVEDYMGFFEHL